MKKGFTLVEMSIVLVVIGLIIGGVLTGRDLIYGATVRATVSQFEKYNAAANTFRSKYNCLPGDCADVTAFSTNAASAGNGDGIIGSNSRAFPSAPNANENMYFWEHLQSAGLINDPFTLSGGVTDLVGKITPRAKIISPATIWGLGGWDVVADAPFDATYGGGALAPHSLVLSSAVSQIYFGQGYGYLPSDMYAIDKKIDDGLPTAGSVRAWVLNWDNGPGGGPYLYLFGCSMHGSCMYPPTPAGPRNVSCITNDTPARYNVQFQYTDWTDAGGLCSAVLKAAF